MKRCFYVVLALILTAALTSCASVETRWQEQYDLGIRYLSEGNYEEAIIAFTAAIEIDEKRPDSYFSRGQAYHDLSGALKENANAEILRDFASEEEKLQFCYEQAIQDYKKAIELDATLQEAYIGLADIYILKGETGKALEILTTALERVSDRDAIQNKIREIERDTMVRPSSFLKNPVSWDEITMGGHPFNECTPEVLAQIYDGFSFFNESGNMFSTYDGLSFTYAEENGYRQAVYIGSAPLEFRGLFCGQDETTALQLLGFTEAGIAYAKSAERTSYFIENGECTSSYAYTDDSSYINIDEFSIELGFISENSGYIHIWFKEGKLDSALISHTA